MSTNHNSTLSPFFFFVLIKHKNLLISKQKFYSSHKKTISQSVYFFRFSFFIDCNSNLSSHSHSCQENKFYHAQLNTFLWDTFNADHRSLEEQGQLSKTFYEKKWCKFILIQNDNICSDITNITVGLNFNEKLCFVFHDLRTWCSHVWISSTNYRTLSGMQCLIMIRFSELHFDNCLDSWLGFSYLRSWKYMFWKVDG